MWKGPSEDPGGSDGGKGPSSGQDHVDQHPAIVTDFKDVVNTNVTAEKLAEFADRLAKLNTRAKQGQKKGELKGTQSIKVETPASDKILMLRQQIEQNKVKIAERGKNQKGIEDMVTQIKAQLDDSQHLISQTPSLNVSLIEDRVEYSPNTKPQELYNILLIKDKRINDLIMKISKLEANVMDLQENVKEKDSVIDARTRAITLMTENLNRKGKNTLDALDETKEQMRAMQENFIKMEEGMREENARLNQELTDRNEENAELKKKNEALSYQNVELSQEYAQVKNSCESMKLKIIELQASPRNSPSRSSSKKGRNGKKRSESAHRSESIDRTSPDIDRLERTIQSHIHTIEENKKVIQEKTTQLEENQKIMQDKSVLLEENEKKICELEKEITELKSNIIDFEGEKKALKHADADFNIENAELVKLKQQLDDSNKNMIKVKAQHKSKIKELNKKIDAFKKISDVNAELVKLESENSKLNQRIAELEEEKGQLQLNMVDSKESVNLEDVKELESKLLDKMEEITSKTELITSLEKENNERQDEITYLSEKLENLSSLYSAQVKSDLTSIQFEEQLERLENEKNDLFKEKENISVEKASLIEKLEGLNKDKQEITSKLEVYMQENAELMDRLEKLSAEKVSSAESIEIVENLTQQEKLELEAYQKSLIHKSSENLEENLNESVHQLNEETSELLQKIELFTVERREVMEKMEALTVENNQLSLKLKEIENNRDVLVETYELLQTEKEELDTNFEKNAIRVKELEEENARLRNTGDVEEYKSLIEIQKQEIRELKVELLAQNQHEAAYEDLREKLSELEEQYTIILNENEKLRTENTNSELETRILDFKNKIEANLEEIENYKTIIEESKDELMKSSNLINDLQGKLKEKSDEVEHYSSEVDHLNSVIEDLNSAIAKLEEENEKNVENNVNVKVMSLQLEDLRCTMNENMQDYEKELEQNSATIKELNVEMRKVNNRIIESEQLLEVKDAEIKGLLREKEESDAKLKQQDEDFHKLCNELKNRCTDLQSRLEMNSVAPLESKVGLLEQKNKEQLEKMKKLAANLKKKTLDYKELESKCVEVTEKWENECKEKEQISLKSVEVETKLQATMQQLEEVEVEFVKKVAAFAQLELELSQLRTNNANIISGNSELSNQIRNYQAQIEDLQNTTREYEIQMTRLSNEVEMLQSNANNTSNLELSRKDDIIASLTQQLETMQYNSETSTNALQMKIQELEMCIETQGADLTKYMDRVAKLEEGLSEVEKRRMSLEQQTIMLGSELQAKETILTENEDYLELRLKSIAQRDEVVEKRMKELGEEKQDLAEKNEALMVDIEKYKKQLHSANSKIKERNEDFDKYNSLESENAQLNDVISNLEGELKKLNSELGNLRFESKQNENELQEQVEQFTIERKLLMEQFEVSRDQVMALTESNNDLRLEIDDMNQKFDQQQIIFEENIAKYRTLENEHKKHLLLLENANVEITELKQELKIFNEKVEEVQEVKVVPKTLAQMFDPNPASFFDVAPQTSKLEQLEQELRNSEQERLQLQQKLQENHAELLEARSQLDFAKNMLQQIEESNLNVLGRNDELEKEICTLKTKLESRNDIETIVPEGNTQEELLKKVKTLEFMLYNVEKDKDGAVLQCHELSNELTRLVYERESKNVTNLESQIITGGEVTIAAERGDAERLQRPDSPDCVEQPCVSKKVNLLYPEKQGIDTFCENDDGWGWTPEEAKLEQEHIQKVQNAPETVHYKQQISQLEEQVRVFEMERENHLEEIRLAQVKSAKLIRKLKEFKVKNDQLNAKMKGDGFDDLNEAIQDELKSQIASLEKKIKEIGAELDKERAEKENVHKRVEVLTSANERMVEMKEKQDIEVMSWQQRNRELAAKLEQLEWGNDDHVEHKTPTHEAGGNKKIDELNEQIKELSLDNDELQLLLEEQRNLRMEAEKAKSVQAIPENMKTESEYNALMAEKNEISLNHEATQEKLKEISRQLQMNYSEKTQLEATILDNNITIDGLNQQLQEINSAFEYLTKQNDVGGELKQKLDVLESEKGELMAKNDWLNQEVSLLKGEGAKMGQENMQLKNEIVNLQLQIQDISKNIEEIGNENVALKENIDRIVGEDKNLLQRIESMDLENSSLRNEILKIQSEYQALVVKSNEMSSGNEQVDEIRNKMQLLEAEKEALSLEMAQLKETLQLKLQVEEDFKLKESQLIKDCNQKSEELLRLQEVINGQEADFQLKLSTTVDQLVKEWSLHVDQRGNDVAESWKLHVETRENEFMQLEEQLRKEIHESEEKCNTLVNENNELRKNVDAEIRNEVDRISALQQQITDRQHQINELTIRLQETQNEAERVKIEHQQCATNQLNLNTIINEKTKEVKELESALTEEDNIVQGLNLKIIECEGKVQVLNAEIEDKDRQLVKFKNLAENLNQKTQMSLETQKSISKLQIDLKEKENEVTESHLLIDDYKNQIDQLKTKFGSLESTMQERDYKIEELLLQNRTDSAEKAQVSEYQLQIHNLKTQLQENYVYIQNMMQEIENYKAYNQQLQSNDLEINRLNMLLQEKEREFEHNLQSKSSELQSVIQEQSSEINLLKSRLQEDGLKWEELFASTQVELDSYKQQMQDYLNSQNLQETEFITKLQEEIAQKDAKCAELDQLIHEDDKQLIELRSIIEEQVLKIEELNKELYEKSSNYDALIAELNIPQELQAQKVEKRVRFETAEEEDLAEPVSRAELDLALYMLHQRDVRCEELTVELMQLLEERDTLQLRLSNAIREKEGMKSHSDGELDATVNVTSSPKGAIPKSKAIILGATGTELAAEAIENVSEDESLANKLSELKSVGYRKDKTIVDEQEIRRIQQFSILQQHKDEVSKLPAEAAARLVDASYTLSRDVQSPSKVLLNWLWGRSTPKVNNV